MTRPLIKCVTVAILWGVFRSIYYLGTSGDLLLSDLIIQFSFSDVEFIMVYLIDLSIEFLPFILFQALFGTYIYQHFCTASVYYFSRTPKRVSWFLNESVKLYLLTLIYPIMMIVSGIALGSINNQIIFDRESIILLIYYVLIHSLWLFITTALINILAIKFDSSLGFISIVGLQMTLIMMLLLWDNVFPLVDSPNIARHGFLLKLNPISHLILSGHTSRIEELNSRLNYWNINFDLNVSVIVFLLISLVVVAIGSVVVKKQEWIEFSREG